MDKVSPATLLLEKRR
jgi:hypothetical protein